MKTVFRLGTILGLLVSILFTPMLTVKAYQYETYNTKNIYGVTYQKFWFTNTLTSWQKQQINDELYRWNTSNNTGVYTPLNVGIGSNQSQSIMDYYYSHDGYNGSGIAGTTFYYIGNQEVSYTNSNWGCAQIWAWGSVYNNQSNAVKTEVWTHETGHGFGLAHNNDKSHPSVMHTPVDGSYNGPTANDLAGINHLYN